MKKQYFNIVEDFLIEYDGDYFDLHKPSDIRSLIKNMNYHLYQDNELDKIRDIVKMYGIPYYKASHIIENTLKLHEWLK